MNNYVITIARGFGSGGKAIAMQLAEKLGIPCYDKELLQKAADVSGINESYFFESDEKVKPAFLSLLTGAQRKGNFKNYVFTPENKKFTSDENLFNFQAQVIRHLGNTETCVIIGRASDYILKDYKNVFSVNIQAPFEQCVRNTMDRMQLDQQQAEQMVSRSDKYRSDFYYYYTGEEWNNTINYDLSLNSGKLTEEECVDIIVCGLKRKLGVI